MSVSPCPTLLSPVLSLLFVSFLSFSPLFLLPHLFALTSLFPHFLFCGFLSPPLSFLRLPASLSLCRPLSLLFPSLSLLPPPVRVPPPNPAPSTCRPAEGWPGRRRAQAAGTVPASGGHSVLRVPARRRHRLPPTCPPAWFAAPEQWPHCPGGAPAASGEWRQAGPCSWRVGKKASGPDPNGPGPPPLSRGERPRARGPRGSAPGRRAVAQSCGPGPTSLPLPMGRLALPFPGKGVRGQFSLQSGLRSFPQSQETEGPCYPTSGGVRNFFCKASGRTDYTQGGIPLPCPHPKGRNRVVVSQNSPHPSPHAS